jgi:hypothetical protein
LINYYSAESVISELKANVTLECEGIDDVGCPSPAPCSFTHEKSCPGNPSVCNDCKNKICNQRITVRNYSSKKTIKLATLFFSFLFMSPYGGRIPVDDSPLDVLIRRKLIDKNKLKTC